jgi:hypothetical protein
MTALRRPESFTYAAILAIAVAASCAKAENSPLADRGDDDGGGKGGSAGSGATGGSSGSSPGGSTSTGGKGGSSSGGSSTGGPSTGGKGGSTSTGGSSNGGSAGSAPTTYGCRSDGEGGAGGEGGASGGAPGEAGAGGADSDSLFEDDFEDGDANGWTSTSGEWEVVDDDSSVYEQTQFDGNTLRVASVSNACWGDQVVEARVKVLDFGGNSTSYSANVFARYLNATTYYVLGINSGSNGQLFIGKAAGGGLERLASEGGFGFDDQEDVWFTLRLEVVGSSLKAYVNGTLELETSDTQITSGGVAIGTTHASARFDDVKVTNP